MAAAKRWAENNQGALLGLRAGPLSALLKPTFAIDYAARRAAAIAVPVRGAGAYIRMRRRIPWTAGAYSEWPECPTPAGSPGQDLTGSQPLHTRPRLGRNGAS